MTAMKPVSIKSTASMCTWICHQTSNSCAISLLFAVFPPISNPILTATTDIMARHCNIRSHRPRNHHDKYNPPFLKRRRTTIYFCHQTMILLPNHQKFPLMKTVTIYWMFPLSSIIHQAMTVMTRMNLLWI